MAKVNLIFDEFRQVLEDQAAFSLGIDCSSISDVVRSYIYGDIDVLEPQGGVLVPYFLFQSIFDEISVAIAKEIVSSFRALIGPLLTLEARQLHSERPGLLPRAFSAGLFLLIGQPERLPFAKLARQALEGKNWNTEVREQAAYYLNSLARIEDTADFWKGLLTGEESDFVSLIPTIFLSLIEKDPTSTIPTIAGLSKNSPRCDAASADAMRFFGRALCDKIGDYRVKKISEKYYPQMGDLLRAAVDELRVSRWQEIEHLPATTTAENNAMPITAADVQEIAANVINNDVISVAGSFLHPMLLRMGRRSTSAERQTNVRILVREWNAALSVHQREVDGRAALPVEPEMIEINRATQLALVGQYSTYEARSWERQLEGKKPAAIMLEHLETRWRLKGRGAFIESCATRAKEALQRVLRGGPLVLGISEFHQDRIIFPIVKEALEQCDVFVQLADIPWMPNERFYDTKIDIRLGARAVTEAHQEGLFEFSNFKAFARTEAVKALAEKTSNNPELRKATNALLGALDEDKVTSVPVQQRALVASTLMTEEYMGDAFDLVASAIDALCDASVRRNRRTDANDQRFEDFVLGRTGIYCGGAINSQMLETWWSHREWSPSGEPPIVFPILHPKEIERGIRAAELRKRSELDAAIFIENYLRFGDRLRRATRAKRDLTVLYRSVGISLADWAQEVCSAKPERLTNGLASSTAASMHMLTDTINRLGMRGHYSYVSEPRAAAHLINQSDKFYSTL